MLRLDPKFPGVHLELGKVYISLRRTDDAIRELELALKENPGDADASYFLGGLLAQEDRYAEAIPYLERARKAKPDFWAPYFYLGKAKLRLEQPAEAVVLLQRAVKLNPDEASAYLPARTGATSLRTRGGSPPRAPTGPRFEGCRARCHDARRWKSSGRALSSNRTGESWPGVTPRPMGFRVILNGISNSHFPSILLETGDSGAE